MIFKGVAWNCLKCSYAFNTLWLVSKSLLSIWNSATSPAQTQLIGPPTVYVHVVYKKIQKKRPALAILTSSRVWERKTLRANIRSENTLKKIFHIRCHNISYNLDYDLFFYLIFLSPMIVLIYSQPFLFVTDIRHVTININQSNTEFTEPTSDSTTFPFRKSKS